MKDTQIGIIGCGVVGGAVERAFKQSQFPVIVYDKFKGLGTLAGVRAYADIIFVCVPTPTEKIEQPMCAPVYKQNLSAVHDVLSQLHAMKYEGPVIVKSTVVPGTMDEFAKKYPYLHLMHNPEFLTERNAERDFFAQPAVLLSGKNEGRLADVVRVFEQALPSATVVTYTDFKVTELAKYIHNCFLATKVAFMNQMFDYAEMIGTNYSDAVAAAASQDRIGKSHLAVPGPDGSRGFGGMCFPKDTQALLDVANGRCSILEAAVRYNKELRS